MKERFLENQIIVLCAASVLIAACLSLTSVGEVKAQASQEPIWSYSTSEEIYDTVISLDGNYIGATDGDNKLYLFSRNSSSPRWSYQNDSQINSIAISSDGSYIVFGDQAGYIRVFSRGSSSPIWNYFLGERINDISISSDGNYIAFGKASEVGLLSRSTQQLLWSNTDVGDVHSIAISLDGNYIVAGDFYYIYLFSRTSSDSLWSYNFAPSPQFGAQSFVDISSDGSFLVAGTLENKIYHFSRTSSTPRWTYEAPGCVDSVAISSDSNYVAASTNINNESGIFYLFSSWESGTPKWSYSVSTPAVSVDVSSDGSYIAASSRYKGYGIGGILYLFSRSSSTPLWNYQTYRSGVSISSNGDYVAAEGYKKVYLFGPNNPPSLTSGSVSPPSGTTATTFTYEITYTDADGDSPSYVRVYIDGSQYTMSKVSGTYTSGATYLYTTTLSEGSHNYYFETSDGTDTARLPVTGSYSGPTVELQSTSLTVSPSSFTVGYDETQTLTATLASGGSALESKNLSWSATAGSFSSSTTTTDFSGQASVTYYAPDFETTATITASFAGDSQYESSSDTSSATIRFEVTLTFEKPDGTALTNKDIYYRLSKGGTRHYLGTTDSSGKITTTTDLGGQTVYFETSDGSYAGSAYVGSSGGNVTASLEETSEFLWLVILAIVIIAGGAAGAVGYAWKKGIIGPSATKGKKAKAKKKKAKKKKKKAKPKKKYCKNCDLELPPDAEYCPECGNEVEG